MICALTWLRVGVHQRSAEPRQRVQEVMLGSHRYLVRRDRRRVRVHEDLALGAEPVTDPPQPDLANPQHPG
jgi:hypothetical protein